MIGWPPTRKGSAPSLSRSGKRRIVRDVRIIDLRTVPLLDHHHAARPGRGRNEYHKVRTNLMRHGGDGYRKPRQSGCWQNSNKAILILAVSGQHPVLASIASRSFFLIGELLLGNLSKTVVVVGNAPHDRPGFLVSHLIGNRASFLCTKAPMLRVSGERSGWHGDYQEFIGPKKHLVLRLLSQNGPQGSKSFATGS